jgi:hypothetical protein
VELHSIPSTDELGWVQSMMRITRFWAKTHTICIVECMRFHCEGAFGLLWLLPLWVCFRRQCLCDAILVIYWKWEVVGWNRLIVEFDLKWIVQDSPPGQVSWFKYWIMPGYVRSAPTPLPGTENGGGGLFIFLDWDGTLAESGLGVLLPESMCCCLI